MNDDAIQPDTAEIAPETGLGAPFATLDAMTPGLSRSSPSAPETPAPAPEIDPLDRLAGETDDAEVNGFLTMLVATSDMRRLFDRSKRLAQVEANAEVLIVARHDLMVEVDKTTARLREAHGDIPFGSVPVAAAHVEQAEKLLDRLAAYMKGQDDRVVALGDKVDRLTAERDKLKRIADEAKPLIDDAKRAIETLTIANSEAGELIRDARPSVRLVNDWATWTDASLFAYADAIVRKAPPVALSRDVIVDALAEIRRVARDRLGDDGFTIPPAYDDAARDRAVEAIRPILGAMEGKPQLVDAVAQALGMVRAGA